MKKEHYFILGPQIVCVCARAYIDLWRLEVGVSYLPGFLATLFTQKESVS